MIQLLSLFLIAGKFPLSLQCFGFFEFSTCHLKTNGSIFCFILLLYLILDRGTFAPLSCSNLLQSATKNLFVVTSEWDTQIGKQLRAMDDLADDEGDLHLVHSRIFSTGVGVR